VIDDPGEGRFAMDVLTVGEFKSLLQTLAGAARSLSERLDTQDAAAVVAEVDEQRGGFCTSRFSSNCIVADPRKVKISDFVNAMADMLQWSGDVDDLFEGLDDDRPLGTSID
jgi:hypothetical protein